MAALVRPVFTASLIPRRDVHLVTCSAGSWQLTRQAVQAGRGRTERRRCHRTLPHKGYEGPPSAGILQRRQGARHSIGDVQRQLKCPQVVADFEAASLGVSEFQLPRRSGWSRRRCMAMCRCKREMTAPAYKRLPNARPQTLGKSKPVEPPVASHGMRQGSVPSLLGTLGLCEEV
jgi:hypothetical protein